MDSPHTSKRSFNEGDTRLLRVNCTPKNYRRSSLTGEEFSLYNLHKESSPNFQAGQDVLEVGWGDSPEPLHMEPKFELNRTPVTCKKKLETKESPKSSIPSKRRNVRTTFSISSKSVVDIAKYVAEVQELSKNIMKELNAQKVDKNLSSFEDENVAPRNCSSNPTNSEGQRKEPALDNVLESFINEEDDWLSQALSSHEQQKTPLKGNFVKSKSENELSTGPERMSLTQKSRNINNNSFRRTSSFDSAKVHNDFSLNGVNDFKERPTNQYSLQEIERKRLEAKYRKERREIERKKLEALKKLEMKKLKMIKSKPSVIEIVNKIV